jgi:hypothetical protein
MPSNGHEDQRAAISARTTTVPPASPGYQAVAVQRSGSTWWTLAVSLAQLPSGRTRYRSSDNLLELLKSL